MGLFKALFGPNELEKKQKEEALKIGIIEALAKENYCVDQLRSITEICRRILKLEKRMEEIEVEEDV